jgi:lipopolysaccharide transport system permease protein
MDQDFDLILDSNTTNRQYWRDLWKYRELFYFLAWRDILVRYKQTAIGIAWAVLRPLLTMMVFVVVFGKLARLPSEGVPYPILVFTALLPWQMFANGITQSSGSLLDNSNLITKVYFPRLAVPTSAIIVSLVDFAISFLLLLALMAWFHLVPSWRLLTLPLFVLLALTTALGCGFWLAALNVKYRDFRHVVPFLVQFGLYLSPVGFSSRVIPENWRLVYSLNPMVGVIDGFRWAVLGGTGHLSSTSLSLACAVSCAAFVLGVSYFRRVERTFADVI